MFIIIDTFGGPEYAIVIVNAKSGDNLLFESEQEAKDYAEENCQEEYKIVEI